MTKMSTATLLNSTEKHHFRGKRKRTNLDVIIKKCVETEATWGLMQNDIMFAVAFWSMMESGFEVVPQEESLESQEDGESDVLPKNWKHETKKIYEAGFVLPPYYEYPTKLVALPADDILCFNVLVSKVSLKNISLRSLAIHSTDYLTKPEDATVRCKFSGLEDFHVLLKDSIIWPIRCAILTELGIMNPSLCGLSDEIKLKIAKCLTLKEVTILSQTCHDLNRICNDQGLWKSFYHQKFKNACPCSQEPGECRESRDWKEHFILLYTQNKLIEGSVRETPSGSFQTSHEVQYNYESEIDSDFD